MIRTRVTSTCSGPSQRPGEDPLARRARDIAVYQAAGAGPLPGPSPVDECVAISASQLGYMLDGIDWRKSQRA